MTAISAGSGILASVVGLYGELKNDAEDAVRRRQVVGRPDRCQRRPVRLQARRQRRPRRGRRDAARLLHRRHRRGVGPGEHLDHLRPDLQHELRLRRGDRDRRQGLQPGVLGRCAAGAGPGAGGRREQVRQRQHEPTPAPATRAGPRWAASAWRSDRSGSRDEAAGLAPPLCVSTAAATRATCSVKVCNSKAKS